MRNFCGQCGKPIREDDKFARDENGNPVPIPGGEFRWNRLKDRISLDESGCWLWTGCLFKKGYGRATIYVDGKQRNRGVHRLVYEALVGPIPPGLDIDHLCRVVRCCNPNHLEPVTRSENLRRGIGVGGDRVSAKFQLERQRRKSLAA